MKSPHSTPLTDATIQFFARQRRLDALLVLPVLVMLVWIGFSEWQQYRQVSLQIAQNAHRAAANYADRIANRLHTQFIELEFIGVSLLSSEADLSHPAEHTQEALRRFMRIHPDFFALNVQSPDGSKILWSTLKQSNTPIVAQEEFSPITENSPFLIGQARYAKRFDGHFLAMRYVVRNADGKALFMVGSPFKLDRLFAFDIKEVPWAFTLIDQRNHQAIGRWHEGQVRFDLQRIPDVAVPAVPVAGSPFAVEVSGARHLAWQTYLAVAWQHWILEISLLALLGFILLVARRLLGERQRATERMQALSNLNRMHAEINHLFATRTDETGLLQQICELGISYGGMDLLWIGRPNDTGDFEFLGAAGKTSYLDGLSLSLRADTPAANGFCARTWREGRVIYSTDPQQSPFPPAWQARAAAYGLNALASLPIRRGNTPWAVMAIYHHDPLAFLNRSYWFEDLANDLSRGLDRLDLWQHAQRTNAFNQAILDNSAGGIMLLKARVIQFANRRLAEMIGAPNAEALIGRRTRDFYTHPEAQNHLLTLVQTNFARGEQVRFEAEFTRLDTGEVRWFGLVGLPFPTGDFDETWTVTDITEQKRSQEQRLLLASALTAIQEGVAITDRNQRIVFLNDACTRMTGFSLDEVRGQPLCSVFTSNLDAEGKISDLQQALNQGLAYQGQRQIRHRDGRKLWGLVTLNPVRDAEQRITHFVSVLRDITALHELNRQLEYQSLHDPLTHLPNRRALEQQLAQRIESARLAREHLAVGMIDLDDFKPVNDTFGHEAGDRLLINLAERLRQRLREGDLLARLGGDEFVVLLSHIEPNEQNLPTILNRLYSAIVDDFELGENQKAQVGMSLGLALYPTDGTTGDTLLRRADAALYEAKRSKGGARSWWVRWRDRED